MQVICYLGKKLTGEFDGIQSLRCAAGEKMLRINPKFLTVLFRMIQPTLVPTYPLGSVGPFVEAHQNV